MLRLRETVMLAAAAGLIWAAPASADLFCYGYDGEGRIKTATRDDGSRLAYDFDRNDNRDQLAVTTGATASCPTPSGAGEGGGGDSPPGNSPPVANDDFASVQVWNSVTIAVLANDSDPDNDPLTVISVTQGGFGSVAIVNNGTAVDYYAGGVSGSDSFSYTISDGNGGTASATVYVTVIGSGGGIDPW